VKPPVPPRADQPFDAVCFGYNSCDILCLMNSYPKSNTKTRLNRLIREGGGQAATAAYALQRLGLKTRYVGKFGDTAEGDFARESLVRVGVDVTGCLVAPGTQNQVAVIWIDESNEERTISYIREPGLEIRPEEVDRRAVTAGGVLLVDGHNLPATTQAARWAREMSIPVLLDVERSLAETPPLLDLADYILCDEGFPTAYTGDRNGERALRTIRDRHRTPFVAMTMGPYGSLALVGDEIIHTPAFEVDVVDTTGAGDVWHAGFTAGVAWQWEIEDCLRFAAAASALKCRKLGGRAGIGDRDEVMSFLQSARPKRFPV
jgi:sulfofructose kinase